MPMSSPYAPVSSLESQISLTPSAIAVWALATSASGAYDPSSPRACFVLQYVHWPRHPVERGKISTSEFFRTLGKSRLGRGFFSSIWTASPSSVRSTASTTRSIWVTPRRVRPSSSRAVLSPWGTHPAMTRALFRARPSRMTVFIALCDGFFTVHVLTTHASANAGSGSSRYPYAWSWPAMNSESLWLCEHPNVFTCTLAVPGTRGPVIMMGPPAAVAASRGTASEALVEARSARRAATTASSGHASSARPPPGASPDDAEASRAAASREGAEARGRGESAPRRCRTRTTGGRSRATRVPSAASAPPRSSRSSSASSDIVDAANDRTSERVRACG